jgi:excisionase family DNA binding protein
MLENKEGNGNGEKTKTNCKNEANTEGKIAGKVYTGEVNSETKYRNSHVGNTGSSEKFFENLIWLTANEAAEYLRLPSVGAIRVLVCKRKIPFHKLGRNLRFKRVELDRLLEASRNGGI